MSEIRNWTGDEWQEYCMALLQMRHGEGDLQRVPDRDRGDLGIEAFTRDGIAYQCYAPEEPLETRALYEKHRDKLTTDLNKLQRNATRLAALLGRTRLRRWVFMVPRFVSADLLIHGSRKSTKVRSWELEFVSSDFEIQVVTDSDFSEEVQRLVAIGFQQVNVGLEDVTDPFASLSEDEKKLVAIIEDKLQKIPAVAASRGRRQVLVNELLRLYVASENALEELRRQYPDLWLAIRQQKGARESSLVIESHLRSGTSEERLYHVVRDFGSTLRDQLPGLGQATIERVAWGTAADWLMRCPLDFPELADV